jgi:energy-coupling factor transporter ATP-binding protein EcfA2
MRLTPKPLEIGDDEGFTDDNDIFKLKRFGENFANLVQRIDEPLVIALDGPWGSGKSTFAKQWAGLLRQRHVPVIVFDAFANDYQADSFLALAAEIAALARQILPDDNTVVNSFIDKAKKASKVLMPTLAKVAIRGATFGAMSLDDVSGAAEELAKVASGDVATMTEKLIEKRLGAVEEDRATLDVFRNNLSSIATETRREYTIDDTESEQDPISGPLVFIIDELDRCRPNFALSLLEQIKHLFSVDGVCFVLVTHLPQIETVVRGHYGSDMDARIYLEKFFHLRLTLSYDLDKHTHKDHYYLNHLWKSMELKTDDAHFDHQLRVALLELCRLKSVSLRTLERIASIVCLVYTASNRYSIRIPELLSGLIFMRVQNPIIYAKAYSKSLSWREAEEYFQFKDWTSNDINSEYFSAMWQYTTDPEYSDTEKREWISRMLSRYYVSSDRLIPIMSEYIHELGYPSN